ncbi:MAG TPA: nuclear transport factor 2 family protein [Kofleriaceae bacterium]
MSEHKRSNNELRTVFENYLGAFSASSPAEQERLLRSSLADDVTFTNPGVDGRGIRSLVNHIAGFQRRFPGGRFQLRWIREQHEQLLAEWVQLDRDGAELVTAHSYARLNEQGVVSHLAGFWSEGAV